MKTTDWFPGTMKPARPGLYQRMLNVEEVWACFDGVLWHTSSPNKDAAVRNWNEYHPSVVQNSAQWRGLAEPQRTDWFPGSVKPVRAGLYERLVGLREMWSAFDGTVWYLSAYTQAEAVENREMETLSAKQAHFQWRGILQ